jgi:hypothetical protein
MRIKNHKIPLLVDYLDMASVDYKTDYQRVNPDPTIALCVVLASLAYPDRTYFLCDVFGRSLAWLSNVFNAAVQHLKGKRYSRFFIKATQIHRDFTRVATEEAYLMPEFIVLVSLGMARCRSGF